MKVLFRYTGFPLSPRMAHFTGHAGKWCWWCIYDILKGLGHDVTPHDWNLPVPNEKYDAVFSIQHLQGIEPACTPDTIKIMRLTMADPVYHNHMMDQRVEIVSYRKNAKLVVRRKLQLHHDHYKSIEQADYVIMNGNDYNRRTYPEHLRHKIHLANTAAANIKDKPDMRTFIPKARHFLWHAGSGAIHKGLDLCLEVFAKHPEWTLHITGNLKHEPDFIRAYDKELNLPNVLYHGWMLVADRKFKMMLENVFAFINPTCSEGQSPAVATCLSLGLYPIISRYTGVDLPEGCGLFIEELTIDCVEEMVGKAMAMSNKELLRQVQITQADALEKYSREKFRETMAYHIKEALGA